MKSLISTEMKTAAATPAQLGKIFYEYGNSLYNLFVGLCSPTSMQGVNMQGGQTGPGAVTNLGKSSQYVTSIAYVLEGSDININNNNNN